MGACDAVAVVPAYEEAGRISDTVAALLAIDGVRDVLVVDDGSRDGTATEALRAGAMCISLGRNRGKGGALNAGIATVRGLVASGRWPPPDAVLLADADLGPSASLLGELLASVSGGAADLAIADLPPQPGAGGFGLVKRLARWGLRASGAGAVAEPLSGQRAVVWTALEEITPFASGFGVEVKMTLDARAARLRVVEVPLALTHAVTGKGLAGSLHRGAQAAAVLRVITRARLHRTYRGPYVRRWIRAAARRAAVDPPPRL